MSSASPETAAAAEAADGRPSILLIVVLAAGVLLALYVATQVIGVLIGIVSPPRPPMPADVREVRVESAAYGVDDWTFTSAVEPCQMLQFYLDEGAACRIAPLQCGLSGGGLAGGGAMIARCQGREPFSIFDQSYEAIISRAQDGSTGSELRVVREVYWLGSAPQPGLPPTVNP